MEPLTRITSPLPDLPRDLKEKQVTLGSARLMPSQLAFQHEISEAKRAKRDETFDDDSQGQMEVCPVESLRDPVEIVKRIRLEPSLGFLYLSPAVDRSCVNYNYYNFK